jgi:hypothetical protein
MRSHFFVALLSDPLVEMAILFPRLLTFHPLTAAAHLLVLPLFQSAPTEIQFLLAPNALGSARLIGRAVNVAGKKATPPSCVHQCWLVWHFAIFAFKMVILLDPLAPPCRPLFAPCATKMDTVFPFAQSDFHELVAAFHPDFCQF